MIPAIPPTAVIDTNAVLDWLVFRDIAAAAMGEAIAAGRLRWLVTPRLLDELRWVLARPLADRWEVARKHALTIDLGLMGEPCDEPGTSAARLACRDKSDQMFADLALARAPCWLLTRDRALLALRRRGAGFGVRVATPAQWHEQMRAAPP